MTERIPTILLVDDDLDLLATVALVLERGVPGARVLTAAGGEEALAIIERERTDLVITDQDMPRMTGLELLTRIRASHPGILLAMMTAASDVQLAIRALNEKRIVAYFHKPMKLDDLVVRVRELLRRRAESAEKDLALARAMRSGRGPDELRP